MAQTYKTVREAAIAGTRAAIDLARLNKFEYGGYVLKGTDGYYVTPIVTSREKHSVDLSTAIPEPYLSRLDSIEKRGKELSKGDDGYAALKVESEELEKDLDEVLLGSFHVHLTGGDDPEHMSDDRGEFFSGRDIFLARRLGILSWLGHTADGAVYEIDGRSQEGFDSSKGRVRMMSEYRDGFEIFARMIFGGEAPMLVKGTQIFLGDKRQEEQRQAA